ncbi:MAG: efflux RND transporter periplasmic adaptor subunit [Pseudohongiellaceae bacterium]|nr:efflux RND transporter periplasmic adaptor subunit [Pseudohongiellaceae bacterium]
MSQQDKPTQEEQSAALIPPHRKAKSRKKLIFSALLLAMLAIAYFTLSDSDEVAQDEPLIALVERGDIENTISSAGSLKPSDYVDVGAQVSGQLQKLYVEVGDLVEEGQLLAEIDARTQQSRVEASRAAIEALEAQIESRTASLNLARANSERQTRLMAANATSQQDYDTAISNLANAEASLIQLQKQIQQSRSSLLTEETQLEYTRIYAPITGTVVSIEMNEGRTLNANQQAPTILRVADLTTMTVETEISEADIGKLTKGMPIYFTTLSGGDRRWYGELRQILPTPLVENNVVLYTGLFDVENRDGSLLPEMTAQVFFITSAARDVLTIPFGALSFNDEMQQRQAGPSGDREGATPAFNGRPTAQQIARMQQNSNGNFRRRAATPLNGETARRKAQVQVIAPDGSQQQREVVVGVTSRVRAEVIEGLSEGEQVVAGIVQAQGQNNNNGGNTMPGIPRSFR